MHALVMLIFFAAIVAWAGEMVWVYQQANAIGDDPLRALAGAAIFFVAAAPVYQRAPDLVDRMAEFWGGPVDLLAGKGGGLGRGREQAVPRLIVQGKTVPLTEERLRIGRYPNNDVVLDHPTVSAYHAEIVLRPDGRHELVDRESRNGTRINGNPIRSAILRDGDQITLGAITLHYLIRSSSERGMQDGLSLPKRRLG
jgi:hypothetical protein